MRGWRDKKTTKEIERADAKVYKHRDKLVSLYMLRRKTLLRGFRMPPWAPSVCEINRQIEQQKMKVEEAKCNLKKTQQSYQQNPKCQTASRGHTIRDWFRWKI